MPAGLLDYLSNSGQGLLNMYRQAPGALGDWAMNTAAPALMSLSPGAAIQDSMQSGRDAGASLQGGDYMGALKNMGWGMLAAGGVIPGVAPEAKAARTAALDMSEAARMQRAGEQGYTVNAYHGLGEPLQGDGFVLGHGGRVDQGYMGQGLYFTESPSVAGGYASRKAAALPDGAEAQNIMPVMLRMDNPLAISSAEKQRLSGLGHFDRQDWAYDVQGRGHDGVIVNYDNGKREFVVYDPSQVRSRFAAFDPARITSPDLLAGAGGLGLLGYGLWPSDAQAGQEQR